MDANSNNTNCEADPSELDLNHPQDEFMVGLGKLSEQIEFSSALRKMKDSKFFRDHWEEYITTYLEPQNNDCHEIRMVVKRPGSSSLSEFSTRSSKIC